MKGIELAKSYYEKFGKPMIENEFATYKDKITVGICGEGSECFGFDDEVSTDHDFDMGFCLFITQKDYEQFGFKLERAYSRLPKEFMGFKIQPLSPVGGNRRGVIIVEEFYKKFLGNSSIPNDLSWWFYPPSHSLACASNGEIFYDSNGEFSKIRKILLLGYPEDVRRKKLSAHLALAGQSGQYNYERCINHGERGSASLSMYEFVKHVISIIYLLNNKFEPFYKWAFKGIRTLPICNDTEISLEQLLETGNANGEWQIKREIVEDISRIIIEELKRQNLTKATCNNLETHAYSVNDTIIDNDIRNMHVMDGIN